MPKIDELLELWSGLYEGVDTTPIEVALGTYASIFLGQTQPLWALIVAPSSSLKTEVCRSLHGLPETVSRDELTAAAFRSGSSKDRRNDLLDSLNGKVLVIKDFTTVLSRRPILANELLGTLRAIHDGTYDKQTALGGHKSWEGSFAMIAASTGVIDRWQIVQQTLGERFLKVRFHGTDKNRESLRATQGATAGRNVGEQMLREIREEIGAKTAEVFEPLRGGFAPPKLTTEQYQKIGRYASFATRARSTIDRDFHKVPYDLPDIEEPGRLSQQLTVLIQALAAIRKIAPGKRELDLAKRVAFDCVPRARIAVLRHLTKENGWMRASEIHGATGVPKSTLSTYVIPDLVSTEFLEVDENPRESYRLKSEFAKTLREVFGG